MATIAIGDVHGNRAALDDLLVRLDPELQSGDTVVFLGDYIDRGPDTRGCIDSILRVQSAGRVNVVTLAGNHEDWLLRTVADPHRHSWLIGMEGFDTIASYSEAAADILRSAADAAGPRLIMDELALPYDEFLKVVPPDHLAFLRSLRLAYQADDAIFVHGGLNPAVPLQEQSREDVLWGTTTFLTDYAGPATAIYGHWDNARLDDSGWPHPTIGRASIGIDTISHGVLTAVRWPDRRVFQSARYRTA